MVKIVTGIQERFNNSIFQQKRTIDSEVIFSLMFRHYVPAWMHIGKQATNMHAYSPTNPSYPFKDYRII